MPSRTADLAIGGVALNWMAAAIEIGDVPIPDADLLRAAHRLGFGFLLVAGAFFAALTVGTA